MSLDDIKPMKYDKKYKQTSITDILTDFLENVKKNGLYEKAILGERK